MNTNFEIWTIRDLIFNSTEMCKVYCNSFHWDGGDILSLIDSIYKGYPIGNIVLCKTSSKDFKDPIINDNLNLKNRIGIIDGLQRISSIVKATLGDGVFFSLCRKSFHYSQPRPPIQSMPLNKTLDTIDFLEETKNFDESSLDTARKLVDRIYSYKIQVAMLNGNEEEILCAYDRLR